MTIRKLHITNIRNLATVTLQPSVTVNVLYGLNGSGKTSVLEAIHCLGLARSFRSARIKSVIRSGQEQCTVFGLVETAPSQVLPVGVSRCLQSEGAQIRVAGTDIKTTSALAQLLPLQVINPDTFQLLEGPPSTRRHFLDWGVFHVKHPTFLPAWQRMQKALKQRNSLLRRDTLAESELMVWNHEFCQAADAIDTLRTQYIAQLIPCFNDMLNCMTQLKNISLHYHRGWDKHRSLADVLQDGLSRDRQSGYTHAGPQRADISVRLDKQQAADSLSRGQIKLVVCALKLAQGHLLSTQMHKKCLFLIDDLPAELDALHRRALCQLLQDMACQVFITCIEKDALSSDWLPDPNYKLFHVKQGHIELITSPEQTTADQATSLETAHE